MIALHTAPFPLPVHFTGTLIWPMSGEITQRFSCSHTGVDIDAPMYTPITAAGDGVVLLSGPNPWDQHSDPQAWIVVIAHGDTIFTWYNHVDDGAYAPVLYAGQPVKAGHVIAYVGMTGRTTGPHLHFSLEANHEFVDPLA
jgi:murein DD-endopeptidase MepM/ murein hydrolase activator NlpD